MNAPAFAPILALLQATDRNGAVVARLDVRHWPVTVGRALTADLVLDDSHLAGEHLRIDRTVDGSVTLQVLDTVNGISLGQHRHDRDAACAWPVGESLTLGRLKLSLRLADEPLAAEEPLSRFPWRSFAWTLLAVIGMLGVTLGQSWITLTEPSQLARSLPAAVAAMVLMIVGWSGLWALATKLFTGRLQFWRHVRIACFVSLALQGVMVLVDVLAFMFSLESLAHFEVPLMLLYVAVAIYAQLTVIVTQRRRSLAAVMACVAVLGVVALMGANWLQNKRLSNKLYLFTVYPPFLRVAPAVPVTQFLQEAGTLRERLDNRLKDRDADSDASDDSGND